MKHEYFKKFCSLLVLTNMGIASCHAINFTYKGGPRVKTDGDNFEIGLNGRWHFDVHSLYPDTPNLDYPPFGSLLLSSHDRDKFNWRRTYATLTRKIHSLNFKFENDFAVNATTAFPHSLREAWVLTKLGPGQFTVGQFKPYRGLEEITSLNEIKLMERPSTSSTGLYNGRQFLTGIGYRSMIRDNLGVGINVMSLSHFGLPLEGISYGGRAVWLPIDKEGNILHLGFSISRDTSNKDSLSAKIVVIYGAGWKSQGQVLAHLVTIANPLFLQKLLILSDQSLYKENKPSQDSTIPIKQLEKARIPRFMPIMCRPAGLSPVKMRFIKKIGVLLANPSRSVNGTRWNLPDALISPKLSIKISRQTPAEQVLQNVRFRWLPSV